MAQGREITKEQWQKFEETLPTTLGLVAAACEKIGINRWTYYAHRNADPEFAERCDNIIFNQVGIPYARDKLMEAIFAGEGWAIRFYLMCKDPMFRPKSIQEIDATVKTLTQTIDVTPDASKVLEIWREIYDKQFEPQPKTSGRKGKAKKDRRSGEGRR